MNDINGYKAKKRLKKKLLSRAWKLESYYAKTDIVTRAYLYDPFDSNCHAMAGYTGHDISEIRKLKEPISLICGVLDQQFKRYVSSNEKQLKKRLEDLGLLMGLYMVNTETYTALMNNTDPGYRQFIILLYRNKHTGESTFRPFSLISKHEFLSSDEVETYGKEIINRDEQINPHYFNPSPVIPIRS